MSVIFDENLEPNTQSTATEETSTQLKSDTNDREKRTLKSILKPPNTKKNKQLTVKFSEIVSVFNFSNNQEDKHPLAMTDTQKVLSKHKKDTPAHLLFLKDQLSQIKNEYIEIKPVCKFNMEYINRIILNNKGSLTKEDKDNLFKVIELTFGEQDKKFIKKSIQSNNFTGDSFIKLIKQLQDNAANESPYAKKVRFKQAKEQYSSIKSTIHYLQKQHKFFSNSLSMLTQSLSTESISDAISSHKILYGSLTPKINNAYILMKRPISDLNGRLTEDNYIDLANNLVNYLQQAILLAQNTELNIENKHTQIDCIYKKAKILIGDRYYQISRTLPKNGIFATRTTSTTTTQTTQSNKNGILATHRNLPKPK